MLDSFTQFYFSHLDGILNVLTLVLILLFLILFVVIFLNSKNKKNDEGHSDELEKTLRKVLESAELKASPMPMPTGNTDVSEEAFKEVENLKKTLSDKSSEIATLRKQIEEKQASGSGEDTSGLQLRLKELEAKLAEYEIIEDDIANLSMYKEENKRLRSELDKVQAGGVAAAAPAVAPVVEAAAPVAPTPAPVAQTIPEKSAAIVEEVMQTPEVTEPPAPAAKEPTPSPAPVPEPVAAAVPQADEDDIMSEFVQAVADQGVKEPAVAVSQTPIKVEAAAEPIAPTPAPPKPDVNDDILAEFEAAAVKSEVSTKVIDATSVTDDIMAEFEAAVQEKEKQKPTAEIKASTTALDENTDTDKILSEMDSLLQADVAAPSDEAKDPTEKLINEFESLTNTKT
jgi:hypothetical protein